VPEDDPKDLQPPIKYKLRRARHFTEAEVRAAADRAEVRSQLAKVEGTAASALAAKSAPEG
jgi:hypothetical protein